MIDQNKITITVSGTTKCGKTTLVRELKKIYPNVTFREHLTRRDGGYIDITNEVYPNINSTTKSNSKCKKYNRWGISSHASDQPNIHIIHNKLFSSRKSARSYIKNMKLQNNSIWDALPIKLNTKIFYTPIKINVEWVK